MENVFDIKNEIVKILLQYPYYKLVGAYSIIKTIENNKTKIIPRETIDIDIRICCELCDNNIDHLKKILEENGFVVNYKLTKMGNFKLTISKNNISTKMDVEFKPGYELSTNIKNLQESFRDKFELKMKIQDRMFKNIIDPIICLKSIDEEFGNKGLTKEYILNLLDDVEIRKIDLDLQFEQSRKFNPKIINGLTLEEYIIAFNNLVCGLLDNEIRNIDIFYDYKWMHV